METFLVISYIMSNNKSSTIKIVWECGKFTCNEGIRNAMVRSRFENIL